MIDAENLKIKYILGSYLDDADYPTTEDFEYLYFTWIKEPNGAKELEARRNMVKDQEGYYFTYYFVLNIIFKGDKTKTDELIEHLISIGKIQNIKNSITYKLVKIEY